MRQFVAIIPLKTVHRWEQQRPLLHKTFKKGRRESVLGEGVTCFSTSTVYGKSLFLKSGTPSVQSTENKSSLHVSL